MKGKKNSANDDPDLVFGLRNIAIVDGSSMSTALRRAERAEIPVARLGHVFVGNRRLLLLAKARRDAERGKHGAADELARADAN
jgi:hypothetical protein